MPTPSPMTLRDVTALLRLTLVDPARGARAVLSLGIPREHHWMLFLLAITLSGAVYQLGVLVLPSPPPPEVAGQSGAQPLPSGLTLAAMVGGQILFLAAAIRWIGRMAGGTGAFEDVLLLAIWFQFLQVALLLAYMILTLVAPFLSAIFFLLIVAFFFWVLTNFIAVVHGFTSLGRVFLGMVLALFAFAFLVSLLLSPFVSPPTGA